MTVESFRCAPLHELPGRPAAAAGLHAKTLAAPGSTSHSLVAGVVVLDPGARIRRHFHNIEELQYVLHGNGISRDIAGREYPVGPGSVVYCGPGRDGAHEFENTTDLPLALLFVYPQVAETTWVDQP